MLHVIQFSNAQSGYIDLKKEEEEEEKKEEEEEEKIRQTKYRKHRELAVTSFLRTRDFLPSVLFPLRTVC